MKIASRPKPGLFTLEQRGLSMWRTLAASRTGQGRVDREV